MNSLASTDIISCTVLLGLRVWISMCVCVQQVTHTHIAHRNSSGVGIRPLECVPALHFSPAACVTDSLCIHSNTLYSIQCVPVWIHTYMYAYKCACWVRTLWSSKCIDTGFRLRYLIRQNNISILTLIFVSKISHQVQSAIQSLSACASASAGAQSNNKMHTLVRSLTNKQKTVVLVKMILCRVLCLCCKILNNFFYRCHSSVHWHCSDNWQKGT